jgi:uroporphyrinogen-III synthase
MNTPLLLTAPVGYAQRLRTALEEQGMVSIHIPTIETVITPGHPALCLLVEQLASYDYLAFSSRKAIESFTLRLEKSGKSLPASLRCIAIGKDNELLTESLHVQPAFIAPDASPMGLVNELARIGGIAGKRIAVLAPQVQGMDEPDVVPHFVTALQQLGMEAERIPAYLTRMTHVVRREKAISLIESGDVSGVIFTSGGEIEALLRANYRAENADLQRLFSKTRVICYGPYTAAHARKQGLKVDFVSDSYASFQGFALSLRTFFTTII